MARDYPQHRFRPSPELDAQIKEYMQRERRRSVNEALTVLVSDALERWRLSKLPTKLTVIEADAGGECSRRTYDL